ncbi:hypothetical protein ACRRTK_012142 [Alexandromys fortis]
MARRTSSTINLSPGEVEEEEEDPNTCGPTGLWEALTPCNGCRNLGFPMLAQKLKPAGRSLYNRSILRHYLLNELAVRPLSSMRWQLLPNVEEKEPWKKHAEKYGQGPRSAPFNLTYTADRANRSDVVDVLSF